MGKVYLPTRKQPSSRADTLDSIERRHRGGTIVEEVGQTVRLIVVVAGLCFLFWCCRLIVGDLAGKITDANVALKFLGNLEISMAISWAAGVGGLLYGYGQRSLKRKTVRHLHSRVEELETLIDPKRSSSKLSRTGDTNPKDQ